PRVVGGGLALRGGRTDWKRQLDLLEDPLEEQVALRRLQLLRVLFRVRELAERALELLAHRAVDGGHPRLLEARREARADLGAAYHVLLGRGHADRRRRRGDQLLDDRVRLAEAVLRDGGSNRPPVRRLELLRQLAVDPLGAPRLATEVVQSVADAADLAVSELERLEDRVL